MSNRYLKKILKLRKSKLRWKRRSKLFLRAYKDESFKNVALEIQLNNYKAKGTQIALEEQNTLLRKKLLEVYKERNELSRQLSR